MKKLVLFTLLSISIISCKQEAPKIYTLKYVVYYPNNSDTVTIISNEGFRWYAYDGTNSIQDLKDYYEVYCSTAPFKILSYTFKYK